MGTAKTQSSPYKTRLRGSVQCALDTSTNSPELSGSSHGAISVRNCAGKEGPLPHDHIGHISLKSGRRAFCIAHSSSCCNDLWSCAMNIGNSVPLAKLTYYEGSDASDVCHEVSESLPQAGDMFSGQYFMCTIVGDLVAVGAAGNKKNRTRTVRLAAAVCV